MFIARISRGRTVRQFLLGTMAAPAFYTFLWLTVFGGAGLRMEREAAGADLCCHNLLLDRLPNSLVEVNLPGQNLGKILCEGACNNCSTRCSQKQTLKVGLRLLADLTTVDLESWRMEVGLMQVGWLVASASLLLHPHKMCALSLSTLPMKCKESFHLKPSMNHHETNPESQEASWWGVTSPDRSLTRLSCRKTEQMWFGVLSSQLHNLNLCSQSQSCSSQMICKWCADFTCRELLLTHKHTNKCS